MARTDILYKNQVIQESGKPDTGLSKAGGGAEIGYRSILGLNQEMQNRSHFGGMFSFLRLMLIGNDYFEFNGILSLQNASYYKETFDEADQPINILKSTDRGNCIGGGITMKKIGLNGLLFDTMDDGIDSDGEPLSSLYLQLKIFDMQFGTVINTINTNIETFDFAVNRLFLDRFLPKLTFTDIVRSSFSLDRVGNGLKSNKLYLLKKGLRVDPDTNLDYNFSVYLFNEGKVDLTHGEINIEIERFLYPASGGYWYATLGIGGSRIEESPTIIGGLLEAGFQICTFRDRSTENRVYAHEIINKQTKIEDVFISDRFGTFAVQIAYNYNRILELSPSLDNLQIGFIASFGNL
ncbi:MAG: hypothetical protein JEY99_07295 [Spirochaetales bacterium]|nr:hypothetical protein [Spirochaetales bacterium]